MKGFAILAVFAAAVSSAVAFAPSQPRALTARAVARAPTAPVAAPKTVLYALEETEDDVETNIIRGGLVAGIGVPILAAPFSESLGTLGGAAIVTAISFIWVSLFVKLLQKVGM